MDPLPASPDPAVAFDRLRKLLAGESRTEIVVATEDRLHAVCRTRLGFADDLEACLDRAGRVIHVRSASRVGYYDFGVNRARIEALRARLCSD